MAAPAAFGGAPLMRFLPQDAQQVPLAVKYETSRLWPDAKALLGVNSTGAAIAVALYDARLIGDGMVSYSRSQNYYCGRTNHPLLGYRNVVGAASTLDRGGWIDHCKQVPGGRGWQSAMKANYALCDVMNRLGAASLPIEIPRQPIILRDAQGLPLDVPRSRTVSRMAREIYAVNEAISSTDARSESGARLDAPVVRIFNRDMKRGGRLYGVGASWQNVQREARQRMTIDGEPVAELDFSTLHPAMLYAEIGAPLPVDCYDISPWPRPLVKRGFLVLINALNIASARLALAHCDAMQDLTPATEQVALRFASSLITDIKARHAPIAKFFHTDAGARLMRSDSDLAVAIMQRLMRKGILAFPVHDSFMVPVSKRDALEEAMLMCAAECGLIQCKVTEVR